jgi:hypothetical protein
VFSLGLTFLQMVLLLSDQQITGCNDPKIVNQDGSFIDTTQFISRIHESPGYVKVMGFVSKI